MEAVRLDGRMTDGNSDAHGRQLLPSDVFPKPETHPYYIAVQPWVRTSAGIKIMHLLCHLLNLKGYFAYLLTSRTGPYVLTRLLTEEVARAHFEAGLTPIAVYNETQWGNPLQAPCVARFLGNYAGLLGGPKVFDEGEMIFGYSKELVAQLPEGQRENVLCMPGSDFNIFHPPAEPRQRRGACFYAGKYKHFHGEKTFPITDDAVEITRDLPASQTPEEIAELFWRSEVFYCYENSALSVEAAMCGCPVVLLPNKHFREVIAQEEVRDCGIAWGAEPEALAGAKETLPSAYAKYMARFPRFFVQLDRFIAVTQARARATPYTQLVKRVRLPYESRGNIAGEMAPRAVPEGRVGRMFAAIAVGAQLAVEVGSWELVKKVLRNMRAAGVP